MYRSTVFGLLILILYGLFSQHSVASSDQAIDNILSQKSPPFGVVFEVAEGNRAALDWAIPKISQYAERLRQRFPEIGIAVVSHGKEQFALMANEEKDHQAVHNTVKSLVKDQNIPVHICGTHASRFGKGEADFPDYVDVAPAGPTEIKNYVAMGYERVVVKK